MHWRPERLLRFRLRSLFLVVLVAAVAMRVWLRPRPVRQLPGGATIQCDRFVAPAKGGEATIPDGAYTVRDRHGRLQCVGRMKSGAPIGRWTFYHPNGRRALAGTCRDGQRVGTWTVWDEQGRLRATFRFAVPGTDVFPPNFFLVHGEGLTSNSEFRQGRTTTWWDNGRIASDGEYRSDVRHGKWTLGERDGTTREVDYVAGRVLATKTPPAPSLQRRPDAAAAEDAAFVRAVEAATRSAGGDTLLADVLGQSSPTSDESRTRFVVQTLARRGAAARSTLPALERFEPRAPAAVRFDVRLAQVAVESPRAATIFETLVDEVLAATAAQQDELLSRMARAGAGLVPHLERLLDHADENRMLLALVVLGRMTRFSETAAAADAALVRAASHARPGVAKLAPMMRERTRSASLFTSPIPLVAASDGTQSSSAEGRP